MRGFSAVFLISLFYLSAVGWIWQDPVAKKNNEGVKLYNEDKAEEALSKWRDAQIDDPDKKELHYNIGSALYKQEKYEDAFKEYEKSLSSKDTALHAKTYYNMGNSSYRMGRLPEAIEYYKKTLEIDPDDEDAKYNIEFIRKKMKENQQKQELQQDQQEKQREGQKGDEEQESQGQEQQAGVNKREEKEQVQEGDMSKEDAVRLLDAMKDDEKGLQRELRKQPGEGRYRVEKDW